MTLEEELIHALYITGCITFEEAGLPEMAKDVDIVDVVEIDTGYDEDKDMIAFLDSVVRDRLGIITPRLTIECMGSLCRIYA